jgi:dienelactone hydrolase
VIAERPVFFASGPNPLFGVLTAPDRLRDPDLVVIVLPESVPTGMRSQNGVLVRMARALAQAGYASFRFDYHGTGESVGPMPQARRDEPFLDDLDAAFAWLRDQGYGRFLLAGACFGAQTALLAVPGRAEIGGVALLACLVASRDDEPALPSPLVAAALGNAAGRGVPVLFCYGTQDPQYEEFEAARRGGGMDAALASVSTEVVVLDGAVHSFLDVDLQPVVIDTVVRWVDRVAGALVHAVAMTGSWTSP